MNASPVPVAGGPRRKGLIVAATFLAGFALNSLVQVVQVALGMRSQPLPVALLHLFGGAMAAAAAVGAWRERRWSAHAALSWGVMIAILIVSLGPLQQLSDTERRGLWFGAASVLLIGGSLAFYLRKVLPAR